MDPADPAMDPNHPAMDPNHSAIDPDHPAMDPNHPAMDPDHSAMDPDHPAMDPDHPAMDPNHSVMDPDHPAMDPNHPAMDPDHPAMDPGMCTSMEFTLELAHILNAEEPISSPTWRPLLKYPPPCLLFTACGGLEIALDIQTMQPFKVDASTVTSFQPHYAGMCRNCNAVS